MAGGERSESVKVFARLRPQPEGAGGVCVERVSDRAVRLNPADKLFSFDGVFPTDVSQEDVFSRVGAPAVERVCQGYNATVFVYGQTGSGKTHTMMAPEGGRDEALSQCLDPDHPSYPHRGLIPRAVTLLLEKLSELPPHMSFEISVNYYEIYMEEFFDLLADGEPRKGAGRHDGARFHIRGLGDHVDLGTCSTRRDITSAAEVLAVLRDGARRRHTSRTAMNDFSSRSHCVLRLRVTQQNRASCTVKESELNMTDLAGSERVGRAEVAGLTAAEGRKINLSLTWLGTVVREICDRREYVHYLDSKLTRVLQNALGGNALTSLICVMSQALANAEEARSTLDFASHAARVRNIARIGEQLNEGQLRLLVRRLQEECSRLRQQVEQQRRRSCSKVVVPSSLGSSLRRINSGSTDPEWAVEELEGALDASQRAVAELQEQVRMMELESMQNSDLAQHHAAEVLRFQRAMEVERLSLNERLATLETALESRGRRCQELESEGEYLLRELREHESRALQQVEENADLRVRIDELSGQLQRKPSGGANASAPQSESEARMRKQLEEALSDAASLRASVMEERQRRLRLEECISETEGREEGQGKPHPSSDDWDRERERLLAERAKLIRRAEAARDEARADLAEERGQLQRLADNLRGHLGERSCRVAELEEVLTAAVDGGTLPAPLGDRARRLLEVAGHEDDLTRDGLADRLHEPEAQREMVHRAEGAFAILKCGLVDLKSDINLLCERWTEGTPWREVVMLGPRVAALERTQRAGARRIRRALAGWVFRSEFDDDRSRLADAALDMEQELDGILADLDARQHRRRS
eukprot:TRINITY_DN3362_c0_g1_i1.p1 TRINITY_DN3362_c0_g1~~TRINITY_DN3362_c0_g1_i1.p1  ORF type:complete len:822 (+),score=307.42 TRINITY_DN3362_c0_g1_i1:97-2562(+)